MPSKSKPQARLMAGAAHDPEFAAKVGVPQSVAKEFNQADKGTGILSGPKSPAKKKRYAGRNNPRAHYTYKPDKYPASKRRGD